MNKSMKVGAPGNILPMLYCPSDKSAPDLAVLKKALRKLFENPKECPTFQHGASPKTLPQAAHVFGQGHLVQRCGDLIQIQGVYIF